MQESGVDGINFGPPITDFHGAHLFLRYRPTRLKQKRPRTLSSSRPAEEDFVRFLSMLWCYSRARLAGPLPRIEEAVSKSETVIKILVQAGLGSQAQVPCPRTSLYETQRRSSSATPNSRDNSGL